MDSAASIDTLHWAHSTALIHSTHTGEGGIHTSSHLPRIWVRLQSTAAEVDWNSGPHPGEIANPPPSMRTMPIHTHHSLEGEPHVREGIQGNGGRSWTLFFPFTSHSFIVQHQQVE